jgi:hypothetical protein
VLATALAGCGRAPSARERALGLVPADRTWLVAADGRALGEPAFRGALDALRAHLAPSAGCVLDAAPTAEAIAAGVDRDGGGAIVAIVGCAPRVDCPALAHVADGTCVAATAVARGTPSLDDPRWARARRYLLDAPLAVAGTLGDDHVVAVARPEPREAWIAIDARDPDVAERALRAALAPTQATFERAGGQVVARLADVDLGELVGRWARARDVVLRPAPTSACPHDDVVLGCDGARVRVRSLRAALDRVVSHLIAPVVVNSEIVGVRIGGSTIPPLDAGDIVEAIDGRRVRAITETFPLRAGQHRAELVIRRGAGELVIELADD